MAGCASLDGTKPATVLGVTPAQDEGAPQEAARADVGGVQGSPTRGSHEATETGRTIAAGTGRFVKERPRAGGAGPEDTEVTLSFDDAELADVVQAILGETLEVTYLYDPRVSGRVTLHTSAAVRTQWVLSILETVLRMNGAAMLIEDGLYRIVPANEALKSSLIPQVGGLRRAPGPGYTVRVVPLEFSSATQMQQILEPFAPTGSIVRVDTERNLLVLLRHRAGDRGAARDRGNVRRRLA